MGRIGLFISIVAYMGRNGLLDGKFSVFYHGRKRIMMSPSPVAPHAPISLSAYAEDPAIGPSPTLQQGKLIQRSVIPKASMTSSYLCDIQPPNGASNK